MRGRVIRAMLLMLLSTVMAVLISGCNYKDIDRRIFVVAIGIDPGKAEGTFKVSLKLAIPQGDVTKIDEKMQILTEESESISEALRRMKSKVEKELDYVHCKSVVLGEKIAAKDIRHVVDWAVRRRDIQLIINFAVGRPGGTGSVAGQAAVGAHSVQLSDSGDERARDRVPLHLKCVLLSADEEHL
ncbi:hypothetical protein ACFSQ7_04275 [Paenibacillus rhizoplanae]